MSVKTEVLKLLETSRERDLSGQEMAESLGVTRSALEGSEYSEKRRLSDSGSK